MWIKEQRQEGGITCPIAQTWVTVYFCLLVCVWCEWASVFCYPACLSTALYDRIMNVHTHGYAVCTFLWTSTHVLRVYLCAYRVKSSSSSLFCRVCLGWAIFAQLGSDWSRRLMSSSFDQEALMVSFSSHWTIPLRTDTHNEMQTEENYKTYITRNKFEIVLVRCSFLRCSILGLLKATCY